MDAVHGSYPQHLVVCFQIRCHALGSLHLLNNALQTILCLLVQIGKISSKLPLQNQIMESHRGYALSDTLGASARIFR